MLTNNSIQPTDSEDANRTSHSLIGRVKENDPDAWERLVKLYSPLVYFWCQESGLPQSDIHDVFQEVFHALARNIGKFRRIENGSFRGWLRTMTRNKLNDHFRKSGREPRPIGGTEALHHLEQLPAAAEQRATSIHGTPDHLVSNHATSSHLEAPQRELEIQNSMLCQALTNVRGNFAEQTWNAFWMVVIDGREANDVAKDLSMRPGTVRVAKSRVLKRLRLEIGDCVD